MLGSATSGRGAVTAVRVGVATARAQKGRRAADAFEARKAELKGDGTAGRWLSPLTLHVLPKLGKVPVTDLDQRDIRDTLAPIWHTKADTARKAMNRLSIVMKHAAALGLDVDLQATERRRHCWASRGMWRRTFRRWTGAMCQAFMQVSKNRR